VHLFAQAGRLAFADRNQYVADTDFITVPVEGMLDKTYLASRAAQITGMDMGTALPGVPPGDFDPYAPDTRAKLSGTSHVSIVDRYGNALSMTTTVESSFGNGVMVRGFLLNNELTARGHSVGITAQESGLSIIQGIYADHHGRHRKGHPHTFRSTLVGGADLRRDGNVGGR